MCVDFSEIKANLLFIFLCVFVICATQSKAKTKHDDNNKNIR